MSSRPKKPVNFYEQEEYNPKDERKRSHKELEKVNNAGGSYEQKAAKKAAKDERKDTYVPTPEPT